MDVGVRLQRMLAAGVQLRLDGDRLDVKAPHPLTDEQRGWVRQHKAELVDLLQVKLGPNLHGWTLEQIRDHCHPDEWREIEHNQLALEAVAAELRRHPFLWSPAYRDHHRAEFEQAAREAAEERAAILEHEAHLRGQEADRVAGLAEEFYQHLFGYAKDSNCCWAPAGRYCAEGRGLKDRYYSAAEAADRGR